jgi:hypothetical protein
MDFDEYLLSEKDIRQRVLGHFDDNLSLFKKELYFEPPFRARSPNLSAGKNPLLSI